MKVVSKSKSRKKAARKGRIKTLELKRETIKDLSSREKRKIKGGGGLAGSIGPHGTDRSGGSGY